MENVTSKDGTTIAFDRSGSGPPVILVSGGSVDRMSNAPLADQLGTDFTVFNYDRRGRGPSGDMPPYAVEREIEDIEAVVEAAGGEAAIYGSSSGAVLAMLAAGAGLALPKVAMWEPPYLPDDYPRRPPADTAERFETMVAEGRRGDAVEFFMAEVVGLPPEFVAGARRQPFWEATEGLAHTLAYDARIMGDYRIPTDRAAGVKAETLVIAGGADMPFMRDTAQALADALPDGHVALLDGQGHNVDPLVLAPVLNGFFTS